MTLNTILSINDMILLLISFRANPYALAEGKTGKPAQDKPAAPAGAKGGAGIKTAGQAAPSRADRAREQLARIVELFSSTELPDMLAKSYLEPAGSPSDKWSLGNRLIMTMEGTYDARGYRQWQQVGRHVVRGRKAIYIIGPTMRRRVDVDKETGEETVTSYVVGFHAIPVFRYEDTDGEKIKTVKREPKRLPPLADVAARWGIDTRYDATRHGEYGSYSKSDAEIRLCTDDISTFFHELAHAAHSRIEELKPGQDPQQEATAQLVACVLGRTYGYDVDGYTYNYIAHYAGSAEPAEVGRMCYRVLGKVEKILDMILGGEEAPAGAKAAQSGRRAGGPLRARGRREEGTVGCRLQRGTPARCAGRPAGPGPLRAGACGGTNRAQ